MRTVREPVFLAPLGDLAFLPLLQKLLELFLLFLELCFDFVVSVDSGIAGHKLLGRWEFSFALLKLAFKHVNACLRVQYLIFESVLPAVVRRYGRASVYGKA